MRKWIIIIAVMLAGPVPALAMDGVNADTGDAVTVEDGTKFNAGDTVAVFDADGNETDLQVVDITDNGDTIDVDFINPETQDVATITFVK